MRRDEISERDRTQKKRAGPRMMLTWKGSRGKKEKRKGETQNADSRRETLNWTRDEKEFRKGWP